MHTIVTHPGTAHKDDFLATCVLLATLEEAQVFRREATEADLANPQTYVIDVGMVHEPERHNFDHHQDRSLPCAFHLVMQHLGHHEAAMQVYAWYPHMSMMDVRGPYHTAEKMGIDTNVLFATSSPIEGYVLASFARTTSLTVQDPLWGFMKELGVNMITMIDRKMARLERLKSEAVVVPVGQYKAVFSAIEKAPKLAMELYLRHLDDDQIVMTITPSNRGVGWELLRLGDDPRVDFRSLADDPAIRFVHGTGFLAKTHQRLPQEEVIALAQRAISRDV